MSFTGPAQTSASLMNYRTRWQVTISVSCLNRSTTVQHQSIPLSSDILILFKTSHFKIIGIVKISIKTEWKGILTRIPVLIAGESYKWSILGFLSRIDYCQRILTNNLKSPFENQLLSDSIRNQYPSPRQRTMILLHKSWRSTKLRPINSKGSCWNF